MQISSGWNIQQLHERPTSLYVNLMLPRVGPTPYSSWSCSSTDLLLHLCSHILYVIIIMNTSNATRIILKWSSYSSDSATQLFMLLCAFALLGPEQRCQQPSFWWWLRGELDTLDGWLHSLLTASDLRRQLCREREGRREGGRVGEEGGREGGRKSM